MKCARAIVLWGSAVLLAAAAAYAPAWAIESEPVDPHAVFLDGAIRDWGNANFLHLERPQDVVAEGEGWRGPEDSSLAFAVNHDDRTLYFAFEVTDDYMVRTPRHVDGEDHIEIVFAVAGGPVRRIGVFAGEGGTDRAAIAFLGGGGGAVPGARVAYQHTRTGYTAEVSIPWLTLLGGHGPPGRASMRAAVLLVDCDSAAQLRPKTVLGTAHVRPGDPTSLDPFTLADADQGLTAFTTEQGLQGIRPHLDIEADVVGDGRAERLTTLGPNLVITGPGVGAASYFYVGLPVSGAADILELRAEEITGDDKREILVRYRQSNGSGRREVLEVFRFAGDQMQRVFAHEVRKESGANHVQNVVRFVRAAGPRGPSEIDVSIGEVAGWSEATYREAPETEIGSILLPWEADHHRRFRFDAQAGRFARVEEPAAPAKRGPGGSR